jgi:hypothetical protein
MSRLAHGRQGRKQHRIARDRLTAEMVAKLQEPFLKLVRAQIQESSREGVRARASFLQLPKAGSPALILADAPIHRRI